MAVVVTGASGHVGGALVRALLAEGASVRALVRSDVRPLAGLDVEVVRVDVADREGLGRAFRGAEVVYHAAAQISLEVGPDAAADAVNVCGTRHVVDACRGAGVRRLVHFSTAQALGEDGRELRRFPDGPRQGLAYDRSKVDAERVVLEGAATDLDAVVVSPCAVVGPPDHKPSYMGRVLLWLARRRLPATVAGGQSWVDVRDVALAAMAAARVGVRGERYVIGGHWLPLAELAVLACRAAGVAPPPFRVPRALASAFAPAVATVLRGLGHDPLFTRGSLEQLQDRPRPLDARAGSVLGHRPRPIETTLADAYAWFEAQGLLAPQRRAR
ncbi:MAG: NAD-dependent epimerase/dehydratase family protein [Myxococcales bacterium]|nr:NAD-dependent epimerase/dehydratase family protein [Myxococcales bacterium]